MARLQKSPRRRRSSKARIPPTPHCIPRSLWPRNTQSCRNAVDHLDEARTMANNRRNNERDEEERETNSAGQSGDIQGMSRPAEADSESVEELVEEGNAFEASIVDGVENAKDPNVSEVPPRQAPEDDVPEEYRNDNDRVA